MSLKCESKGQVGNLFFAVIRKKRVYFLILFFVEVLAYNAASWRDPLATPVTPLWPLSGDCKYKFGPWGSCDAANNTKSRSGTLKRALFNADCQSTVKVSKPCSPKVKKSRGETWTQRWRRNLASPETSKLSQRQMIQSVVGFFYLPKVKKKTKLKKTKQIL